ncbi:hypothetical protein SAMN05216205_2813 [Pseudomonas mohnii]|jgi:hypothetical protein|uniref:Uncharacterized protein n=1 Tax=Pseudomonas mohnii TaxID=395600 RepID=A0ABY0XZI6_9PSED|nr:hypothetical protein SAMN05216205_2813 [Pseudomonas mohnii]
MRSPPRRLLCKKKQTEVFRNLHAIIAPKCFKAAYSGAFHLTGQSSQALDINGTLPERYPATHLK